MPTGDSSDRAETPASEREAALTPGRDRIPDLRERVRSAVDRSDGDLSRRRMLALAGTGLLGSIAGCSGGGSDGTDTPADTPTETPTDAPTPSPTATGTPTETATATASPTATQSIEEMIAEYNCPDPEKEADIVVAQDGSGDFETVGAAIEAIPHADFEGTRVRIEPGTYKEKLQLPSNKTDVTFVGGGDSPEDTILTYDDHADKTDENGQPIGTSGSSSFFVWGPDFTAKNLTFRNNANPVAQAVAIRIDADRAAFENCRFIGNQDTLYNYGERTRQYFKDCYVEGDVDFIFGSAAAYFDNCEIFCKDDGYIAAPAQPEDMDYGYVFNNCTVHGDAPAESVYLGRPWQRFGQAVFMNTSLSDIIRPQGWEPWVEADHPDKTETAFMAEHANEGAGYKPNRRVDWSHQLSDSEAEAYTVENVFPDWNIRECLNQ
jgi:pectinesterase